MKIGFVFPGQGAQVQGMGKDLYDKYEQVKSVYKKIDNAVDLSLEDITFCRSQEELNETKNTQIAIFTMSMGILEILKSEGIKAQAVAGLSLGEYTALTYANVFSLEEGAKLVKRRGELMQNFVPDGDWAMSAIIGLEDEEVEDVCNKVREENENAFVRAVNFNCPGQVAISGERQAVQKAMEIAKNAGAKRVVELKTSGPFHTEKLKEASERLKDELKSIPINSPKVDVIKNINGEKYMAEDDIKEILSMHVINPVKFSKCIENMLDMGIDTFIEVGPRKSVIRFCKKSM